MSDAYIRSLKATIETDRYQISTLCEHRDILLAALEGIVEMGTGEFAYRYESEWPKLHAIISKVRDEWL